MGTIRKMTEIQYLSVVSLYIEMYIDGAEKPVGKGTAFAVKKEERFYLITNWHCVTGINPLTDKPLNANGFANPDYLKVWFCGQNQGSWKAEKIPLKDDDNNPIWIEHADGKNVDVVAIPFIKFDNTEVFDLDLKFADVKLNLYPSKAVSIIGFPKGLSSGGKYPVWKKGHLASEFGLDYNNQPVFLIDATTRGGMSGSPVFLKESGMCEFENKGIKQGDFTRFLGIYSGRIDKDIEIGRVWRAEIIDQII